MNSESEALRAENCALKHELDTCHKRLAVCDEKRQMAEDQCRSMTHEIVILRAQMDIIHLIFGGVLPRSPQHPYRFDRIERKEFKNEV